MSNTNISPSATGHGHARRGAIHSEEYYARAKMLNHEGWAALLPRNITPSDVDMIFDNQGRFLFVELKANTARWAEIPRGQRCLYENLIRLGLGDAIAACAQHADVPTIDTTKDIVAFQYMRLKDGMVYVSPVLEGSHFPEFVQDFYRLT